MNQGTYRGYGNKAFSIIRIPWPGPQENLKGFSCFQLSESRRDPRRTYSYQKGFSLSEGFSSIRKVLVYQGISRFLKESAFGRRWNPNLFPARLRRAGENWQKVYVPISFQNPGGTPERLIPIRKVLVYQ